MPRDAEAKRAYDRDYAKKNQAKRTAYFREWRAKNPGYERIRHAADPEKNRDAVVRYRLKNPDRVKRFNKNQKLKRYGLTLEDFEAMIAAQDGRCAICSDKFARSPHVDHCHRTGAVREILCDDCNNVLGRARDNTDILRRAITYLERHTTS